ncbi:hypothetical protein BT93_L5293 [Corymbia citriodora subsp. variegata]|uniref:HNH nuclease domain-containing protein n=1 Tax=Corymbia citriodora subsp. variegata TaxID=360336 RepID=A0A8T0CSH3_CORYI|nr:hypothetical protein BT93_L5293 [Corymbia citriodora subsp. variegata]
MATGGSHRSLRWKSEVSGHWRSHRHSRGHLKIRGPWLRMVGNSAEQRERERFFIFIYVHIIKTWHFFIGPQQKCMPRQPTTRFTPTTEYFLERYYWIMRSTLQKLTSSQKKRRKMFPNKKHSKRRPSAAAQSSPSAPRPAAPAPAALPSSHRRFTPSTSLIDQELETLQDTSSSLLESLQISLDEAATPPSPNPSPRSFPYSVKQQCWDKAESVKGRDPDRWRRDAVGNIVFRKLVGCAGCLCHDYDHILPYSKGGKSTLENCQVLQATVNRSKGNQTEISRADLIRRSSYCRVSDRDMDLLELSAYGNVRRDQDSGGCRIQ